MNMTRLNERHKKIILEMFLNFKAGVSECDMYEEFFDEEIHEGINKASKLALIWEVYEILEKKNLIPEE
jgi:hypothetical protein